MVPESGVLLLQIPRNLKWLWNQDFPLNRPLGEIQMLTTHANENSEGRNNQGKEILHLLTGYINHHVPVNRNLDFKNTASKGSKRSEKHVTAT